MKKRRIVKDKRNQSSNENSVNDTKLYLMYYDLVQLMLERKEKLLSVLKTRKIIESLSEENIETINFIVENLSSNICNPNYTSINVLKKLNDNLIIILKSTNEFLVRELLDKCLYFAEIKNFVIKNFPMDSKYVPDKISKKNYMDVLVAKICNGATIRDKRNIEKENIKEFYKHDTCLFMNGIFIPSEVSEIIFAYCQKDIDLLNSVGVLNSTFYKFVLSCWEYINITNSNLRRIPLLVYKYAKEATVNLWRLVQVEDLNYIKKNIDNVNILHVKVGNFLNLKRILDENQKFINVTQLKLSVLSSSLGEINVSNVLFPNLKGLYVCIDSGQCKTKWELSFKNNSDNMIKKQLFAMSFYYTVINFDWKIPVFLPNNLPDFYNLSRLNIGGEFLHEISNFDVINKLIKLESLVIKYISNFELLETLKNFNCLKKLEIGFNIFETEDEMTLNIEERKKLLNLGRRSEFLKSIISKMIQINEHLSNLKNLIELKIDVFTDIFELMPIRKNYKVGEFYIYGNYVEDDDWGKIWKMIFDNLFNAKLKILEYSHFFSKKPDFMNNRMQIIKTCNDFLINKSGPALIDIFKDFKEKKYEIRAQHYYVDKENVKKRYKNVTVWDEIKSLPLPCRQITDPNNDSRKKNIYYSRGKYKITKKI